MNKNNWEETFQNEGLGDRLSWFNEPTQWELKNNQLKLVTDPETDFWQKTHYGFQADNGHFLFSEIDGDFIIETDVDCDFKNQYDQAGLLIRISDQCWIKTSVEYETNEPNKLGVVVTNHGYSDWSTQDVDDSFTNFKLRVCRNGSDYKVEYFQNSTNKWVQLRLFHLFDEPTIQAGLYACSPKNNQFTASFNYLKISTTNE